MDMTWNETDLIVWIMYISKELEENQSGDMFNVFYQTIGHQ